jgi:hypothetical protein
MTIQALISNPVPSFLLLVLFGGIWLFTDTHVLWYRLVGGTLHGVAHIAAAFVLAWAVSAWLVTGLGLPFDSIGFSAAGGILMVAGGWIVGSILMGLYLLVSLNVFGRHYNEAFSSLQIEDWKSFLKLHISPNGVLSIYALGIARVPRDDHQPPRVELIEPIITVAK